MSSLREKKILLVGGSGFIGTMLAKVLLEKGCFVTIIDLAPPRIQNDHLVFHKINLATEIIDQALLSGFYGVVNLAGATIGKRWNKKYKKIIYASRIETTHALVSTLAQVEVKPSVVVSASAVGYYGDQGNTLLTEEHAPGNDFLSGLCLDWETEALKARTKETRVVLIRTANVLGPGGLLTTLEPLFRKGLGGYFGNGTQYMPWIHWKDIVGIYVFALEQNISGPFNVGSGATLSQKEIFKTFAKIVHAPFVWPIPKFAGRIILGDFIDALVASANTDSKKIREAGYVYAFSDLSAALIDIYH